MQHDQVRVDGKVYHCGVPVLSKTETTGTQEDTQKDFPFDLQKLRCFEKDTNANLNVKILAEHLLYLHKQGVRVSTCADTTEHRSKTADTLRNTRPHTPKAKHQALFHCGDIVDYAERLSQQFPGKKIAILNPANRKYFIGKACLGANALEEIYSRSSSLPVAYAKHAFESGLEYTVSGDVALATYSKPMGVGEAWFTDNITFYQKPAGKVYTRLSKPFSVSVIGSTAPDYPSLQDANKDPNNEAVIKEEIRAQLTAALENGVDIPVLTAFGCGAFNNNPESVARYYWEVLYEEGYADLFDTVHFAIWQDPNPHAAQNFSVFLKKFKELTRTKGKNIDLVNLSESPEIKVMKYHNNYLAGLAEGDANKYLTDEQKSWQSIIEACQKTVEYYVVEGYEDKIDIRFKRPGFFPLDEYFTQDFMKAQDIELPVIAGKAVFEKLREMNYLAPEAAEPGVVEKRQFSKFGIVYSEIPFMTNNGLEIRKVITANGPNLMNTSPLDIRNYITPDNKLDVAKFTEFFKAASLMVKVAKQHNMDPFVIAEFSSGAYLKVLEELSPEQADMARHCIYLAFASAAKHYDLPVEWMFYEGKNGIDRPKQQVKADFFNEQFKFSKMKFVVGDVMKAKNLMNNGSDRTIGGKGNVNFALPKPVKLGNQTMKGKTTEEQVNQVSWLMHIQTTLNPHFPLVPQAVKLDEISSESRGIITLNFSDTNAENPDPNKFVQIMFPDEKYAADFSRFLYDTHNIHQFNKPTEPLGVRWLNPKESLRFIRLGKTDYNKFMQDDLAYDKLLLNTFIQKHYLSLTPENLDYWQAQTKHGGESFKFQGVDYRIPGTVHRILGIIHNQPLLNVNEKIQEIARLPKQKLIGQMTSMFTRTDITENLREDAQIMVHSFADKPAVTPVLKK